MGRFVMNAAQSGSRRWDPISNPLRGRDSVEQGHQWLLDTMSIRRYSLLMRGFCEAHRRADLIISVAGLAVAETFIGGWSSP